MAQGKSGCSSLTRGVGGGVYCRPMEGPEIANECSGGTRGSRRRCLRRGCQNAVKKATGKYCSVRCCSLDPERHARLRERARRGVRHAILPLSRQLVLDISTGNVNPEALIERLAGREDVPAGMSRLAG